MSRASRFHCDSQQIAASVPVRSPPNTKHNLPAPFIHAETPTWNYVSGILSERPLRV